MTLPRNFFGIFCVLSSYLLFFFSLGMNVVLVPLFLKAQGVGEFWMGVAVSVELVAGVLVSYYLSAITKRFGVLWGLRSLISLHGIVLIFLPFYRGYLLWLLWAFVLGASLFGVIGIILALYNQFLENHSRGRYMAVMSVFVCIGLMLGPILVAALDGDARVGFFVSSSVSFLAILPTLFLRVKLGKEVVHKPVHVMFFLKRQPRVFVAKFVQEFIVNALFFYSVIYLLFYSFDPGQAGLVLSAFAGSSFLNLGVGLLVDRMDQMCLIGIGFFGFFLGMIGVYFFHSDLGVLLGIYFGLGICMAMMHLSIVAIVNNRFPNRALVSANAGLGFVGSIGGILGMLVVGGGMQWLGAGVFPVLMAGAALGYLGVVRSLSRVA